MPEALILVPASDRRVDASIPQAICRMYGVVNDPAYEGPRWTFHFDFAAGKHGHDYARNFAAGLRHKYPRAERVLWLDDDMGVDERLLYLLNYDGADIVTGMYAAYGRDKSGVRPIFQAYPVMDPTKRPRFFGTYTPQPNDPPVIGLEGCGFGCVAVKRHVLDDPRMLLPRTFNDIDGTELRDPANSVEPMFRFVRHSYGKPAVGEDLDWCYRARQLGYTIHGLTGVVFDHWKLTSTEAIREGMQRAWDEGRAFGAQNPPGFDESLAELGAGYQYSTLDPGEPGPDGERGAPRYGVCPQEGAVLGTLARGLRVLEIGTGLGRSTSALAASAAYVCTVDPDEWVQATVAPRIASETVECLTEIPQDFPVPFDMAFIDGMHTADAVESDLRRVLPLLRPGATVVLHDWERAEVREGAQRVLPGTEWRVIDTPARMAVGVVG